MVFRVVTHFHSCSRSLMASFFRPYFSLKLAASRTRAKCAADPGWKEGQTDYTFRYHLLLHVLACPVRWKYNRRLTWLQTFFFFSFFKSSKSCKASGLHFLQINSQLQSVVVTERVLFWYIWMSVGVYSWLLAPSFFSFFFFFASPEYFPQKGT